MDGEAQYFSALLDRGRPGDLRSIKKEHLGPSWQAVYDFVLAFSREYQQLPTRPTVAAKFRCDLPDSIEPPTYYAKVVRDNAMRASMERGFEEKVVEPLARTKPADALAGAQTVIADLRREFKPIADHLSLDIAANVSERLADYNLRRASQNQIGIPFAWPTMTASTGGRQSGEGIVIASRPNKGKTWAEVVDPQFCREIGYNCLFVSGETAPQASKRRRRGHRVVRGVCINCYSPNVSEQEECPAADIRRQRLSLRFDAVGARVSAFRLLQGALQPQEFAQLKRYYDVCRDPAAAGYGWGRLKIISVPAISSVVDLEMAAEEFEPDAIWFDSAYVLANRYKGNKRNEAASRLIFDLKDTADRLGVPMTISWHFNRDVNGDKDTTATQNSLALTDEISRLFDVIIGLFRPSEVEDAGEAIWQTLKVRDGIRMPELRTHFRMKQEIRFDEIGVGEPGE
jgi:hypothetical protein